MEVVSMAHRGLLHNSIILLIISTGFFGCHTKIPENPVTFSMVRQNKSEAKLTFENGLLVIDKKPFNGTLFTLFPATTDTAELMSYLDGKEHGERRKFYPQKKIREKRFFKHGQKTGEYMVWWENGNEQLHYFFEADEYEGTCKEWNVEGKLVKVMNYKKGHEEGHQQWWYDNGKVKANYVIREGRRYGLLGTKNCINVSDSVFSK
jgi:antitoxin component YwqK of YwqJK toxin-antitoxin module